MLHLYGKFVLHSKKSKHPLYEMAYDDIKVLYQTEYLQLRELSNHLMKQLKKEGI